MWAGGATDKHSDIKWEKPVYYKMASCLGVARTYIKKTPVASPEPVNKQTTVHPLAAAQVVSLSSVGPKPPPRTYIKRIQDTPKAVSLIVFVS